MESLTKLNQIVFFVLFPWHRFCQVLCSNGLRR